MRTARWAPLLLVLIAGCAPEPFQRPPLPVLDHPDPRALCDRFAKSVPARFITDDTVIIHAPFHDDLAVLAVLQVDRDAGTFELSGLNPLGVELFRLSGDRTGTRVPLALGPLEKQKDVLLAMAEDVRRMYFDLLPSQGATASVGSTSVRFRQDSADGKLDYEIGGDPPVVLEKHVEGLFGPAWRVRYYDYFPVAGGLYPRGIVMDNGRYHYRIVIKNRLWQGQ